MSTFGIYLIGYVIFVIGVCAALYLLGVPPTWIVIAGLVLAGLGIATGAGKTRRKDTDTQ